MRHSWFHYLSILLIVGQSLMAMGDLDSFDQVVGTYSELVFLNEIDTSSAKSTIAQNSDATVDGCLDCSDCNCCNYSTLSTANLNPSFDAAVQSIVDHELLIKNIPRAPYLRPPKI